MFYGTVPNKIVIKLTKLKRQNVKLRYLQDVNQLAIKNAYGGKSSKYAPVE